MLIALGMGACVAPLTSSVMASVDVDHVGVASGFQQRGRAHRRSHSHRIAWLGVFQTRQRNGLRVGIPRGLAHRSRVIDARRRLRSCADTHAPLEVREFRFSLTQAGGFLALPEPLPSIRLESTQGMKNTVMVYKFKVLINLILVGVSRGTRHQNPQTRKGAHAPLARRVGRAGAGRIEQIQAARFPHRLKIVPALYSRR